MRCVRLPPHLAQCERRRGQGDVQAHVCQRLQREGSVSQALSRSAGLGGAPCRQGRRATCQWRGTTEMTRVTAALGLRVVYLYSVS